MKTNKFFFIGLGFITGIVSAISVMGLFAFSSGPGTPGTLGNNPVSATTANNYFKNYMAGATSINQVIKGFMIDKKHLDAMNSIARENPALPGFRIYMGLDNSGQKIAIVVGVDSYGKDAVNNTIYQTDSQGNPCPPVCDSGSPILKD